MFTAFPRNATSRFILSRSDLVFPGIVGSDRKDPGGAAGEVDLGGGLGSTRSGRQYSQQHPARRRIPEVSLFGAVFTGSVCWALGRILFRCLGIELRRGEHDLLAGLTGAAVLSLLIFWLCVFRAAYTPLFLIAGLFAICACARADFPRYRQVQFPALHYTWPLFLFYGVVYLSNSLAPEFSPDGSTYHLGLVARYVRQHGFEAHDKHVRQSVAGDGDALPVRIRVRE